MGATRDMAGRGSSVLNRICNLHLLNWPSLCASIEMIVSLLGIANAKAQEAEPRSYSNTPIGLNFLIAGYVYSEGKMAFDPDRRSPTPNSTRIPGC